MYDPARQEGLSPPLRPYRQPGRGPSPLGLAIVEADPAWLADVGPADACGLPNPKAVANTEDSEGGDGKVCLGADSRGHGLEHTQGAPNLVTRLGVVGPTSPGRNGQVDGAYGGLEQLELFGHANW